VIAKSEPFVYYFSLPQAIGGSSCRRRRHLIKCGMNVFYTRALAVVRVFTNLGVAD